MPARGPVLRIGAGTLTFGARTLTPDISTMGLRLPLALLLVPSCTVAWARER